MENEKGRFENPAVPANPRLTPTIQAKVQGSGMALMKLCKHFSLIAMDLRHLELLS